MNRAEGQGDEQGQGEGGGVHLLKKEDLPHARFPVTCVQKPAIPGPMRNLTVLGGGGGGGGGKTDSIQGEHNIVYGANAGQRVIKPCSSRKIFKNRFFYEMVSFLALCEFSKMFTRPTWQNLIFFKFFCLIVLDLLGLKPNTVRSNLGESKQG